MADVIDGAYDSPKGRKIFVRQRPGESSDDFALRAIEMLEGVGYPLGEDSEEDLLETPPGELSQ
jgi:hypothetical protein